MSKDKAVVLVHGDPAGGFRFIGPAYPNDPALEEMTEVLRNETWWYVELQPLDAALRAAGVDPDRFKEDE